jgi:tRNA pseudouridine55 synthase
VNVSDVRPTEDAIRAVLPRFIGEIDQVPPIFSAVKVAGQRAYALARAEMPVELESRTVHVEGIELIDMPDADHAVFEVTSGKGTYMRALARDLAVALGTVGHVAALRRNSVGPFTESAAIPLDKIDSLGHSDGLKERLLPVGAALDGIPALNLTEAEARRLQRGQPVAVLPVASRSSIKHLSRDAVFCAMAMGRPVALATVKGGEIRPLRVLNL